MNLLKAAELAESAVKKNYFLISCFAAVSDDKINEWVFHFFNPNSNKVVDCFVSQDVVVGEESPAAKKMERLDMKEIKITPEQVLKIAKNPKEALIVLHKKIWVVNVMEKLLVISYYIDAITGKVIKKEKINLIKIV